MDPARSLVHLGLGLAETFLERSLDVVRLVDGLVVAGGKDEPSSTDGGRRWPDEEEGDLDIVTTVLRSRAGEPAVETGESRATASRAAFRASASRPAKKAATKKSAAKRAPAKKAAAKKASAETPAPKATMAPAKKAPAKKAAAKKPAAKTATKAASSGATPAKKPTTKSAAGKATAKKAPSIADRLDRSGSPTPGAAT